MRLIDADKAIKKIADAQDKATTGAEDVTYYRAIKIIRDAPTIEAEPVKHGRWIEKPTIAYCSCCHVHWTKSFIISLRTTYKYCPNCGAKMDGD